MISISIWKEDEIFPYLGKEDFLARFQTNLVLPNWDVGEMFGSVV